MTIIEHKGKTYRVAQSVGFAGCAVIHVEVLTARGTWRITNSRSAVAETVVAQALVAEVR